MGEVVSRPNVSVMIPTLDSIHYIDSAVLSVMSQTNPNWELLAYDDGSTDGTYERLQFWATQDNRIRVARPFDTPKQYADVCNQMLADAQGEFMARVDCDDISLPNRLDVQLDFMRRKRNAVLVGSMLGFIMEAEGGKLTHEHPLIDVVRSSSSHDQPINDAIRSHHKVVHGGTFLARTQDMIDAGGYDNMLPLDDWDVSLRMAEQGGAIYVLPELLYLKRIHAQSASKKHPNRQQAFEAIRDKYSLDMSELPA